TLERIAGARAQIAVQTQHPDAARALGFLDAANDFVAGILSAGQGDFANATELMTHAHEGFEYVGHDELAHASEGLRLFLSGVLSVRSLDLGSGKEQLKQAQEYLNKAGRFGTRFRPLMDHMAPDQLWVAGVEAFAKMDYV